MDLELPSLRFYTHFQKSFQNVIIKSSIMVVVPSPCWSREYNMTSQTFVLAGVIELGGNKYREHLLLRASLM
jgi:hypothetical protein